jgi:hypothetical protein
LQDAYVGQVSTCGGFLTRLGGLGTLVGRPIENRPQVENLPHKTRAISHTGKTLRHAAA